MIEGPTGRRRRSDAERARIAAESLLPGVRVTDLARKHKATRWQVYHWRKRLRNGQLTLPESVASTPAFAALVVEEPPRSRHANATAIEIVVDDVVIRAEPGVGGGHLSRVIRAVRAAT
ncbi:transposase [Aurantimonas sp. C2-6-R+9]|uniref:transposase n=1 Tax=Aurantimonas sp. C2-6-R+9 TaxID=3114365 RepID=UPI002E186178|nr:transposase [Aurantimonas sp. C2-6-R+9]